MTAPEIRPATDEEIANAEIDGFWCDCGAGNCVDASAPRYTGHQRSCAALIGPGLVARIEADRAAAHERDRQIAVLEQERDDDTALIRRLNATAAAQAEKIERLKKREAGLEDALRQFRKVLGPFATKSALALLDAALDAALKPESKE